MILHGALINNGLCKWVEMQAVGTKLWTCGRLWRQPRTPLRVRMQLRRTQCSGPGQTALLPVRRCPASLISAGMIPSHSTTQDD